MQFSSLVASQTWGHTVVLLESVRKLFTRRLPVCVNLTYSARLKTLNLDTLEKRRLIADLVFCFKIIKGIIPFSLSDFGLTLNQRPSRGHNLKLVFKHSNCNTFKFSFAQRICPVWNPLSSQAVSVISFKSKIKTHDFSNFLHY